MSGTPRSSTLAPFQLSVLVATRAKELENGAEPLVEPRDHGFCVLKIALAEYQAGLLDANRVKWKHLKFVGLRR